MVDRPHRRVQRQRDTALVALRLQHRDDLLGRSVAEQLPERLFVPGDAIGFDQSEEILRGVAAQRRFGEMRIGGKIPVGRGVEVGEIAPPAARDQDLLSHRIGMIDQQHARTALPGDGGAHQPCRARAEDDRIVNCRSHPPPVGRIATT